MEIMVYLQNGANISGKRVSMMYCGFLFLSVSLYGRSCVVVLFMYSVWCSSVLYCSSLF